MEEEGMVVDMEEDMGEDMVAMGGIAMEGSLADRGCTMAPEATTE